GGAPIGAGAGGVNIRRKRPLVLPDGPARFCVEGEGAVVLASSVENSIDNERGSFKLSAGHRLVGPLRDKRARVCGVDLIERAEAMARVIAGIHQPVLRLFRGIEQALWRDL